MAAIRAFADVAEALRDVRDLDHLLHLVAQKVSELVGVPRCAVYLKDDATGFFRGAASHPAHTRMRARTKRLLAGVPGDGFTREIVETKAPVVVEDALHDPRPIRSIMREWHVRSVMGVPMLLRGEVTGVVFLDEAEAAYRFTALDQEIASAFAELAAVAINQAQLTAELRSSLATVAQQNKILRKALAVDDRLTSLVLAGSSLQDIGEAVAELTGKPAAIYGASFERVALATPPALDEEVVPPVLELPCRAHPRVEEQLSELAARGGLVTAVPEAELNHRCFVAPVVARDETWGHLVLMEYPSTLGALDIQICRRAAINIALEMSAERRAANAEWNARASLAGELIRGTADMTSLTHRAAYLGVRLDAPRVLCLVSALEGEQVAVPDARAVTEALEDLDPSAGALASGVADGVAIIFELRSGPRHPALEHAKCLVAALCDRLDPGRRLVAALSTPCRSVTDYVRAYRDVQQVAACIERFCPRGEANVMSVDDLGAGRLLLLASAPGDVERFAEDTLGALLVGGDDTADLVTTLQAFFSNGRSIRRSAAALAVHENTVRYRLARVQEITGFAVASNADAQFDVQLALLVLKLSQRLPTERRRGRPSCN